MKKHLDLYTKIILTVIAVSLLAIVLMNLKIVPKLYANEPRTKETKTEIGWCEPMEVKLIDFKWFDQKSFINYDNKFVCPEGYFIIGMTSEYVDIGAGYKSVFVTKIKYAKPCIKE